ncbi:MAG: hypothetical protein F6J86_06230 [Symploca sp. SIO1B1]|nr:hypothetical protein [Symploca sp. SIO1B1]
MRKYIIFKADRKQPGWKQRQLAHTGALTRILAEHYDSSNNPIPKPGYRFREFHQIEQFANPNFPGASTHSRVGDWEVTRVKEYPCSEPDAEFDLIVICYCQYSPVSTPLEPLPEIQVQMELQKVEA